MCLIAFDKQDTNEFDEAIRKCDNNDTVIYNLICLHPSTKPETVSSYICNTASAIISEYFEANLPNSQDAKNSRLYELFAFFVSTNFGTNTVHCFYIFNAFFQ